MQQYNISKNLSEEDWLTLEPLTKTRTLNNKDFLLLEGDVAKEIYWIKKGMLRSFYYNEKKEEITYCITFENSLMTALTSFISGSPTPENIQAIGQVELLAIHKESVDRLCANSLKWTTFFKQLIEEQFMVLENKLFNIQKYSAKKRYEKLIEEQPQYVQHIPVQYLASYLNVTPRHLSRIRNEVQL